MKLYRREKSKNERNRGKEIKKKKNHYKSIICSITYIFKKLYMLVNINLIRIE